MEMGRNFITANLCLMSKLNQATPAYRSDNGTSNKQTVGLAT